MYLFEKGVDLECENIDKWRPIHVVCRYSTPKIIKQFVNKGVMLDCENNLKVRPIHMICKYSTLEIVKLFVDNGVDLECETVEKWRPIHYICRFSNEQTILYAVNIFDIKVKCVMYENVLVDYSVVDLIKMNTLVSKGFLDNFFYNKL